MRAKRAFPALLPGGMALALLGFSTLLAGCAANPIRSKKIQFSEGDKLRASLDQRGSQRASLLVTAQQDASVPISERVVIYNAGLRIVVKDVDAAITATESVAEDLSGYVQRISGEQITIRVPVASYRTAMDRIERLGQVVHRELEALDVTDEYVDLQARLRNARAVLGRLDALLEKAQTVEEALAVEKERKRVAEEIERLTAQLEMLKNRIAYSTITIEFERVARKQPPFEGVGRLPFRWLHELDPRRLWD